MPDPAPQQQTQPPAPPPPAPGANAAPPPPAAPAAGTQAPAPAAPAAPPANAAPPAQPPAPVKEPAKPDAQTVGDIKLPEGVEADPKILGAFKEFAKQPLTPQGVVDFWLKLSQDAHAAQVAQHTAQEDGLKKLWGPAYDANKAAIKGFVEQHLGGEFAKELVESMRDNKPGIAEGLLKLTRLVQPDSVKGTTNTPPGPLSEDAKLKQMYPKSYEQMKALHP